MRWTDRIVAGTNLRLLRLVTIVLPLLFLATYYYLMLKPAHNLFHSIPGFLIIMTLLVVLVTAFANTVFGVIERQQQTILRQNRELAELGERLRSLYQAGLQLVAEVDLPAVQQHIVALSQGLLQVRHAALVLVDSSGAPSQFVVAGPGGTDWHERQELLGHAGAVRAVLSARSPIRGRATGAKLPPEHPAVETWLGVPVLSKGQPLGALLLADPTGAADFTDTDRDLMQLFASQASIALENANLYREVQALATETERMRIAREMHDSVAQVLAYVNTKAQAVDEFLDQNRVPEARQHLAQLVEAARQVYADVREGILGLRTQITPERSLLKVLDEYVREYTSQCGIQTRLVVHTDQLGLDSMQEIQVLRIVQEALTNVRRHSGAKTAQVQFERTENGLRVVVADTGRGMSGTANVRGDRPHFGLQTMRERAESIGGTFHIEENPGGGTRIVVAVPVPRTTPTSGGRTP